MKRGTLNGYVSVRTAQGVLRAAGHVEAAHAACGSACGAGGETKPEEPKPAACGSACGAGEK